MSSYTRDDLIDAWKEGYAQGRDDPFTEEGPSGYGAYHAAAEACADKIAATLRQQAGRVDEETRALIAADESVWALITKAEGAGAVVDEGDDGKFWTLNTAAFYQLHAALAQNTQVDGHGE